MGNNPRRTIGSFVVVSPATPARTKGKSIARGSDGVTKTTGETKEPSPGV